MNIDNWLIFGGEKSKRQYRTAQAGCNLCGNLNYETPSYALRSNIGTLSEIRQHMQTYCTPNTMHKKIQLLIYCLHKQIG